jgi:hypothetical protein
MPPVSAHDELRAHLRVCANADAGNTLAVSQHVGHRHAGGKLDRRLLGGSLDENAVKRLAPHRQTVTPLARVLSGTIEPIDGPVGVGELMCQRRAAETKDALRDTETVKDGDRPRRGRNASNRSCWETPPVEQQDRNSGVAEQRRQRGACNPSADNHDVIVAPDENDSLSGKRRHGNVPTDPAATSAAINGDSAPRHAAPDRNAPGNSARRDAGTLLEIRALSCMSAGGSRQRIAGSRTGVAAVLTGDECARPGQPRRISSTLCTVSERPSSLARRAWMATALRR